VEKRFFKPDVSRVQSLERLKQALLNTETHEEMKNALINEAIFIRTPDKNRKLRYGVNLGFARFKLFLHFRTYENSSLYKFIKRELKNIAPDIDLAVASAPQPAVRSMGA
jgi:hypothetical protein